MTPSKAEQIAESAARGQAIERTGVIPSATDADAMATATETGGDPNGPPLEPAPVPIVRAPEPPVVPQELRRDVQSRNDIVDRFRRQREEQRAQQAQDEADELRDFMHAGLPPDLTGEPEPAPEPAGGEPEPEPAPAAVKRTFKVRGREVELTQDEADELIRKSLASDDYFDESKRKAQEASDLLRQAQEFAQRVGLNGRGTPPQSDNAHLPIEPALEPAPDDPAQLQDGDIYAQTVERIQMGDTAEAAKALRDLVRSESKSLSVEALEADQLSAELARSSKVLNDFRTANPDLAQDHMASAAIEAMVYDLQREDLKAIGVSEDQLPQNPAEIARWHHWYRAKHGDRVKTFDQLLNGAKDSYAQWRAPPAGNTENPARKVEPRVEVTVDRTARRAAIQPQPTRTTQPRPVTRQNVVEPDRTAVVQKMMQDRLAKRQAVVR